MDKNEKEERIARRIRRASKVIALGFTAWFGAQWLGGYLQLPAQLLWILDFAVLVALIWALIELWGIIRISRS